MLRGTGTRKGRGGQSAKDDRPSVLAPSTAVGVLSRTTRRQHGAKLGRTRSGSNVIGQEDESLGEGKSQPSWYERIERGLTWLGKRVNDRPWTVGAKIAEKKNGLGEDTPVTALLPSSRTPPSSTPTAQLRLSDLLGSDVSGEVPSSQRVNGLSPTSGPSTSALPCPTSPAQASLRSSFQTACGIPMPASSGSRRARRSGRERPDDEEGKVTSSSCQDREISIPTGGKRVIAASAGGLLPTGASSRSGGGGRNSGERAVAVGEGSVKKRGKRVWSGSDAEGEGEKGKGEKRGEKEG